ncbi:MAG: zinc ribbon domain-containing protein [Pyrinomonadaceae bacterium]|nr:zinc ribbon domain-containing protein [Pyrinomonadaceae bacterium]
MFCPKCGRDDPHQRPFCPACGTNLEVVTLALAASEDSIFTRFNRHLDRSIARYAEHVFEEAPAGARVGRVRSSWRLMVQGGLTFLADSALLPLIFFFLPFRFLMLILYTPLGLLEERSDRKRSKRHILDDESGTALGETSVPKDWLIGPAGSVTETATMQFRSAELSKRRGSTADSLTDDTRMAR